MKKQIKSFAVVAILLSAVAASSQTARQARVRIPFAFTAAGKAAPAGDYRVNVDVNRAIVELSSKTTGFFMLTTPTLHPQENRSYLRFRRFGDHWVLQEISLEGLSQNVPISKRDRETVIAAGSSPGGELPATNVAVY